MPYIKQERRIVINNFIDPLTQCKLPSGEINYAITRFFHGLIGNNKLCYDMLNSLIGTLECAKLELYRQIAAPYEDDKKLENGSVSKLDENF